METRTLAMEGTEAGAGAMLVACRLAGLSALETYYAASACVRKPLDRMWLRPNLVAAFRWLRKSRRLAGNSKLSATAAVDLTGPGARNDADTHSGRGRMPFGA
jgi:hypothetical protein